MRVLIIEDEDPAARRLANLLGEQYPDWEVIDILDSVAASVDWLRNNPAPDLIFMDIELSDGVSFSVFEKVRVETPVIFTTAYDEYALKAFSVNSIDYLLKPIEPEDLERAAGKYFKLNRGAGTVSAEMAESLLRALKSSATYRSRFLLRQGQQFISLETDRIAYFEFANKMVYVVDVNGKKYFMDCSLDDVEKDIDPDRFFRLNRQVLANRSSLQSLHNHFNGKMKVILAPTGEHAIVSRDKSPLFKRWLGT